LLTVNSSDGISHGVIRNFRQDCDRNSSVRCISVHPIFAIAFFVEYPKIFWSVIPATCTAIMRKTLSYFCYRIILR